MHWVMFLTFPASIGSENGNRNGRGRACDSCRDLKIKCNPRVLGCNNAGGPNSVQPCIQCRRSRLKCTYDKRIARLGRPPKSQNRALEDRDTLEFTAPESTIEDPIGVLTASSINVAPDLDFMISQPSFMTSTQAFPHFPELQPCEEPPQPTLGSAINDILTDEPLVNHLDHLPTDLDCLSDPSVEEDTASWLLSHQRGGLDNFFEATENQGNIQSILEPQEWPNVWRDINEFFNEMYFVFPVLSLPDVTSSLYQPPVPGLIQQPELQTLIHTIRLFNGSGRYRMGTSSRHNLLNLIRAVEKSRLDYDYAENITLDTIATSLSLFTAYNVLDKHTRAFLYLDEAISMFQNRFAKEGVASQRTQRMEKVLFNTESATIAIYATDSRRKNRMRLKNWSNDLNPTSLCGQDPGVEQVAVRLLQSLTRIHLAESAENLEQTAMGEIEGSETLFGVAMNQHQYARIQSADVVLSRQWQLSKKLVEVQSGHSRKLQGSKSAAEKLGIAAMSSICLLRTGELRVVGLGKIAGLIHNICSMIDWRQCRQVLSGLIGALANEDHEKTYANSMKMFLVPMLSDKPATVVPPNLLPAADYQAPHFQSHWIEEEDTGTSEDTGPLPCNETTIIEQNYDPLLQFPVIVHDSSTNNNFDHCYDTYTS